MSPPLSLSSSYVQVVLMLLETAERRRVTQLFEHLSSVQSDDFTKDDVQNMANIYII
jgi:hypothetical protein